MMIVIIRATWSPKLCLLEKKENLQRIMNTNLDIYERAVTLEAMAHHGHTGDKTISDRN